MERIHNDRDEVIRDVQPSEGGQRRGKYFKTDSKLVIPDMEDIEHDLAVNYGEHVYNILLVGHPKSGKTMLLQRYINGIFDLDFKEDKKEGSEGFAIKFQNKLVKANILEITVKEDFDSANLKK